MVFTTVKRIRGTLNSSSTARKPTSNLWATSGLRLGYVWATSGLRRSLWATSRRGELPRGQATRPDHEAGGRRRRGRGRRRRGRRGRGRRVESSQDAHVGNFETLGEDHEVRQGRELHVALTLVCRCHFSVRVHFSVLMVALHFRPSFFDRRGPGYKAPPASGAVARRLFCSCRFSACRQFCCLAVVLHFRHFFFLRHVDVHKAPPAPGPETEVRKKGTFSLPLRSTVQCS